MRWNLFFQGGGGCTKNFHKILKFLKITWFEWFFVLIAVCTTNLVQFGFFHVTDPNWTKTYEIDRKPTRFCVIRGQCIGPVKGPRLYLFRKSISSFSTSKVWHLTFLTFCNARLTLRRSLRKKLRMRWFFDLSRWRSRVFLNPTSLTTLRFLMRIFWKIPI